MNHKLIQENIIEQLTPENCSEKGLEWRGDIFYNSEDPIEAFQDIVGVIQKDKCRLGNAASRTIGLDWYGLYCPIKD